MSTPRPEAPESLVGELLREAWRAASPPLPATTPSATPTSGALSGGFPTTSDGTPEVHPEPQPHAHAFGEPHYEHFSQAPSSPSELEPSLPDGTSFYFLPSSTRALAPTPLGNPSPLTTAPAFDIEKVRAEFPALHQQVNGHPLIWLDNAATTHKPNAVIEATSRFYRRDNSNIHRAAHTLAARSTELFEAGRENVRRFLGAPSREEIIFVRGTTEGINLVAQTYGKEKIGPGDEIILSELEHHANIVPWQLLAEQVGAKIRVIPINDRGELILEEYVRLFTPRTRIVSVAHVSNALGTVNPVETIIAIAHGHGVPVLIDGAQSTPHLPVNVSALDADFYVFSGHKIYGPTGIGALYAKSSLLETMPPWQGGGHMIRDVSFDGTTFQSPPEKFEAGTPDIAGVIGLGAAIDYLFEVGIPAIAAYEHALLEYATERITTIPRLRLIGTAQAKASVLSFVIEGVDNAKIARHLDQYGIAVRAGHHCAQPSQRHFGLETTVRPSLAFYNTPAEVDTLIRALRRL